jgi:hypothetical protein
MSDDSNSSILGWLAALLRELWSWVLLNFLLPGVNPVPDQRRDSVVNSLSKIDDSADHPLERSPTARILDEHAVEGSAQGAEADVSDEFLSQLEQRTQQVKITLANLEAEKVRIETQIAQLQPIVPHYDALLSAERQLADAAIDLEPARPEPETPSESSGWSSDAPGDGQSGGEQQNSGWSGSWNS